MLDRFFVRIIHRADAEPSFDIDPNRQNPVITYIYDGDVAELVQMAQRAGQAVQRLCQIPILPSTEADA